MKFHDDVKTRIISASKQVYWAYLALEFAKENDILIDASSIRAVSSSADQLSILPLKDYTRADKLKIVSRQNIISTGCPKKQSSLHSILIQSAGGQFEIGGPGKLDLYKMHIANLGIMIHELQTNENPHTILAALATGSGKSFTQALWLLVLRMANVSGIFAAPAKLVDQLHADMKRLLSDSVTQNIYKINTRIEQSVVADTTQIDGFKAQLKENVKPLAIMSYEDFLDDHWDLVADHLDPAASFISFDEQHLVGQREDRAIKMAYIADKFPSMFLTATPGENSYELSGKRALLTLSRRQKFEQGYAVATENRQIQAMTLDNKLNTARPYFKSYADWIVTKLSTRVETLFQGEAYTTANEMLSQVRLSAFIKKPDFQGLYYDPSKGYNTDVERARKLLRWNVTVPAAEKMLIIASDHDTLINVNQALHDSFYPYSDGMDAIYQKGEKCSGHYSNVSEKLNKFRRLEMQDALESYVKRMLNRRRINSSMLKLIETISKPVGMHQYAMRVIFNGIVNNALRMLTGYDFATLDKMRFHDLNQLMTEVLAKLSYGSRQFDEKSLETHFVQQDKLDLLTASQLAKDVKIIFTYLGDYSTDKKSKARLIDNWVYDADEYIALLFKHPHELLEKYVYKCFSCESIENNDANIVDYQPFDGFISRSIPLYLEGNKPNPAARKQKAYGIRDIDKFGSVTGYTTVPSRLTNQQMETAFKLGLMPYLIGNVKAEGFNDENLQVAVHLVAATDDNNNQPAKKIQASGRPRGLNPAKQPIYIEIDNVGVESIFPLKSMDKKEYIPDYLKATTIFHRTILEKKGKLIASELNDWIAMRMSAKGEVDCDELKKYTFKLVIDTLEQLNHNNDHHLANSRKQLINVLKSVSRELDVKKRKLTHIYQVSFFMKALFSTINFLCRVFGYYRYWSTARKLNKACASIQADASQSTDVKQRAALYKKIVLGDCHKVRVNMNSFGIFGKLFEVESDKMKAAKVNDVTKANVTQCDNYALWIDLIQHPVFKSLLQDILGSMTPQELHLLVKSSLPDIAFQDINQLLTFKENVDTGAYRGRSLSFEALENIAKQVSLVGVIIRTTLSCHGNFRGVDLDRSLMSRSSSLVSDLSIHDIKMHDPKHSRSIFQDISRLAAEATVQIQSLPKLNALFATVEKHQINLLEEVNQNLIKPMHDNLSKGCLSGCGLFSKKPSAVMPGVKADAKAFISDVLKAKPITLEEAVNGSQSCLQPLRLKYAQ